MFNLGFSEIIVLGIICLVFIGPKELPEIARIIGRFLNDLKRTTGEFSQSFLTERNQINDQLQKALEKIKALEPHEGDKVPESVIAEAAASAPKEQSTAVPTETTKNEKPEEPKS